MAITYVVVCLAIILYNIKAFPAAIVSVDCSVLDSEHTFGILSCHTEESCNNHPEQSAGTACNNGSGNTYDVSCTDGPPEPNLLNSAFVLL